MKRQKTRTRLGSLLLSLCMVLALLPALTLPAFADTILDTIAVTGITEPAVGALPQILAPTMPAGLLSSEVYWQRSQNDTDWEVVEDLTEASFAEGYYYRLWLPFQMADGYALGASPAVTVNGRAASIETGEDGLAIVCDFGRLGTSEYLYAVNVTGVTKPVTGAAAVTSGITTDTAHVTLGTAAWRVSADNGASWSDLAAGALFEDGKLYQLVLPVMPDTGYSFVGEAAAKVNGENGDLDTSGGSPVLRINYDLDKTVSAFKLTGIEVPAAGAHPSSSASCAGKNCQFSSPVSWEYKAGGTGDWIAVTGALSTVTFAAGNQYRATAVVYAMSGCTFSPTVSGTIDGHPAVLGTPYTLVDGGAALKASYDFGVAGTTAILSQITINGVAAPKVGATPVHTYTLTAGQHVTKVETGAHAQNGWRDYAPYPITVLRTDPFAAEGRYTFYVTLMPEADYAISPKDTAASLAGLPDGSYTASIQSKNEDGSTTILFEFPALPAPGKTYTDSVSPQDGDFGTMAYLAAVPEARTFTLTNTGTGTLSGIDISLEGTGKASFDLKRGEALSRIEPSLAAGAAATFTVQPMDSQGKGTYNASLRIHADNVKDIVISLTFTVSESPLAASLSGDGDWGTLAVSAAMTPRTFTVTNTGTETLTNLTLGGSNTLGEFLVSTPAKTTLAPGEKTTFTVQPAPGLKAGNHRLQLGLLAGGDIVPGNKLTLNLTLLANALTASPDTVSRTRLGISAPPAPETFTLKNNTSQPFSGLRLALEGADADSFTLDAGTEKALTANGITTFTVTPKAKLPVGVYTVNVLAAADGLQPQTAATFTLTVELAYGALLTPDAQDFGSAAAGYAAPAPAVFTVTNASVEYNTLAGLKVVLSGANADSFVLNTDSLPDVLGKAASAEFTVAPKTGLTAGTYTATVQLTALDLPALSRTVTFTVTGTTAVVTGTTAASTAAKSASPKTGDDSNPAPWVALLALGGAGALSLAVYARKRKNGMQ